jgi:pyruvate-formate lyase
VRFQKRLQADIGQRLPIAVGTDKSALESVDADDFADPLDFLIAQRGPLAARAKTCKSKREAVIKQLKEEGILAAGGVNARQAENLLERADAAAANSDLSDFERALELIKKDVIGAFVELKRRAMKEEIAFRFAFKQIKAPLDALRKDVMDRIDEVAKAVKEEVLDKDAPAAANARRVELRRASQEFDNVAERIEKAKSNAWAEDLFAEGTAAIEALRKTIDTMAEALRKDRESEAEARRRKEKEAKRAAGAKAKDAKDDDK